ncbi:uncharacterized protein LOC126890015 isoform X1 [Diabrotica virgifera virgifera]|uniref:Endonuclease/exonuclease/phosphatase domain-containing protein n=1 Tax=Diabrotica virgifera virgifera TaxID=50390 RepID=A0ABM5KX50_DIAVI|nr:uncharacterized protein LOC126890015 isoform X1 [Diabrotica virgifera virgifera]
MYLEGGHILIYSGVPNEKKAAAGVGCVIHKDRIKHIQTWESWTERILTVEMKDEGEENLTIITVYGPDENEKKEIKDKFWEDLNIAVENSKGNIFIIGDFNGRVGTKDMSTSDVIGKYGEEVRNNNGRRLIEFCELNSLIVTNTHYEHKNIHKFTRQGPRETEKSIIDYILIERNNRRALQDIRVRRGPEISSDHYLLEAKIKHRIEPQTRAAENRKKIESETIKNYKLRDKQIAQKYEELTNLKITNLMRPIQVSNLEQKWQLLKGILIETAREACEVYRKNNKTKQTSWWNDEIKNHVKMKKKMWEKYLGNKTEENYDRYKEERKKVRDMIKIEKEKTWIQFGQQMEYNSKENQKVFYRTMKNIRIDKPTRDTRIKNTDGTIIRDDQEIMERWKQHFQELLTSNEVNREENNEENEERTEQEENTDEITNEEIETAIKKLKNGKSPGHDRITPEMLKYMGLEGRKLLREICNEAWKKEEIPSDREMGVILPIHKKGDIKEYNNYRGITLLCTALKVYETVLEQKLKNIIETTLEEAQSGFRKGRGVQDHIQSEK